MARAERGKIEGNLEVNDEFHLIGMATGDITVKAGGALQLTGMGCRDVIVEKGGTCQVTGMVVGSLINRGGNVFLRGMAGEVVDAEGAVTSIHPEAVITGRSES